MAWLRTLQLYNEGEFEMCQGSNTGTERALREKELLLREIHHRVKNNLQVVCSMLRLQASYIEDERLLQVLRESCERVHAMAILHDQLHRAKDLSNIHFGEYIRNLTASLFCSYGVNSDEIRLELEADDLTVSIDTAIPCGLILHELVSNALKHAFPDGKGCVRVAVRALGDGRIELTAADDGRGFGDDPDFAKNRSFGLRLVELLAAQIGATEERSRQAGTRYRFVFEPKRSHREESKP